MLKRGKLLSSKEYNNINEGIAITTRTIPGSIVHINSSTVACLKS
jgi:hypothetical protein